MKKEENAGKKAGKRKSRQSSKKRKEYSTFSNYCYLYKGFFRMSKWHILIVAMILVGGISAPYVGMYIPKTVVSLVTEQVPAGKLVGTLCLIELAYFLLNTLSSLGYMLISNPGLKYRHVLEKKMLYKICRTAYSNLEDPDYKTSLGHAQELYLQWNRDARQCIWASLAFMNVVISILISSGMIAVLHPVLIAVLAVGVWLEYQMGKRSLVWEEKHRDFWQPLDRKLGYIAGKLNSFLCAKELRLYAADKWLLPKYTRLLKERRLWERRRRNQGLLWSAVCGVLEMARMAVVYGFLIWEVLTGRMRPDDFIFYVGLALSLSSDLGSVAYVFRDLREHELSISDYRKMLGMPDSRRRVPGGAPEMPRGRAPEITFSHVSYAYPEADKDTLCDIDFHISPGEKVALVGLNGAGKTTLIKLLCGMYEPTEGDILLNGESSVQWDLEEWYQWFSVVFQDIGVLPATILENVSACAPEQADRDRARSCLEQAGLWELVEGLPRGMDTYLQKEMFKEGVNLSGGETQKLLLARAIYREAPVLVLDEPTAALDAIAENQLYLKYNELTKGRTSLFISHRLSSTRFCDRIIMLEGGRVIEQGSHEELMEKQGAYCHLFQVQSHYYQNDRGTEFTSEMDPEWEVSGYVSD